ncbi:unnamed protein product [Echinostoma caproni]|uniref:Ig-like domain-containing protein n=1 Tax=Echinostoma caproni TaxID=27848 RepID=A0A183AKI7_9TREM|nr:unnamed protein product [Echinostoma caproni]
MCHFCGHIKSTLSLNLDAGQLEALEPKITEATLSRRNQLYVEISAETARWNPSIEILWNRKDTILQRFAVNPGLHVPRISKAILHGKTRTLDLEFTPISRATSYTVILFDGQEVRQIFHVTSNTPSVGGVSCSTCAVAVRAVNTQGKGAFSDRLRITCSKQPTIIKSTKYGPFVYIVIKKERPALSPSYEAFLFENDRVSARGKWYGYYGRIEVSSCDNCVLYVRELLSDGTYSAFSTENRVTVPANHLSDPYFKVDPHPSGFVLEWKSSQQITIIYTNDLTLEKTISAASNEEKENKLYHDERRSR